MLLLLPMLLTGCASPPTSPQIVAPPLIPPLPQEARQPPAPSCSPSCSGALRRELQSWLDLLTPPVSLGRPAKPATTP
jgi:hypothetical protein